MLRQVSVIILTLPFFFACQSGPEQEKSQYSDTLSLHEEVYTELVDNLLIVWYPRTIDSIYGGFLTNFSHDWQRMESQEKMIVTQARHLWTLSKAAQMFPEEGMYAEAATHAYNFLRDKMWDQQDGGFYWLLDREGNPLASNIDNKLKRVYGNAFGVYALAAYYAMSGEEEALEFAQKAFRWIDEHAHDPKNSGYFSTLTKDGVVIDSSMFQQDLPSPTYFYKDQNTSIHLLEAFTELYHVWPDELLEERLREMFHLIRDRMVSEQGYLRLYFYDNWQPISYKDSTAAVREANYAVDHVSFGHDIETAYLLLEASEALEEYEYQTTLNRARQMVDHTIANGIDTVRSGILERGYYLPENEQLSIVDDRKNWWSQAEGLNSLYLFSTFYPEDSTYQKEFDRLWKYTKTYIIDHENGGWYSNGLDTHSSSKQDRKAHIWKGNYHNARTLFNLLRMTERRGEHS
ncbi:AGE family epimerase/isomerase [Porifericola rhodea]|uniref:AGE family epimerase/isomerase n=1 Tax=Porifericola rhodea TaxID=930972 RepID=UPI002665A99C|nr:AGE family epimerase/isomerase [Porifericola rhodea]WKN31440.1 AGE family epimerase/isomerase [Porifericola rhodea]